MRVRLDAGDSIVTFTAGGGLEIDYGADGSMDDAYRSCTDAKLKKCG